LKVKGGGANWSDERPCWEWVQKRVAPYRNVGAGITLRKLGKFYVQNKAFWAKLHFVLIPNKV